MPCRSITTEFEGPAATFAPRNCFWGPANCKHRMSTQFTVTARKHTVPGEQLVELKRLFDSRGPDGNSRCIPRRIRFCVGKPVSPCFLKLDLCAYPSSSSAMPCCCPPAICTIFLSSKPLTGTAKHHELCDIRFRGEKILTGLAFNVKSCPISRRNVLSRAPVAELALLSTSRCVYCEARPSATDSGTHKNAHHVLFPRPVRNSVKVMPAAAATTCSCSPVSG